MAFFSRAQWRASAPTGAMSTVSLGKRDAFVLHYSTGEELGREDCAAWVREIQRFHTGPQRGWSDIGYNFLVCKHGDVFEGRGWNYAGAHAPDWNTRGIGVCFLGDDDPGQDVPAAGRRAIRGLWQEGERLCGPLQRVGHRDTQRPGYTACPGDELEDWMNSGMPVDEPTEELLQGSIREHYLALPVDLRDAFGPPLHDEQTTPDGRGRYNHFAHNASIYWSPETGAHEVHGNIRRAWERLGWETGILGYPTSDERIGGEPYERVSLFQNGLLVCDVRDGSTEVSARVL